RRQGEDRAAGGGGPQPRRGPRRPGAPPGPGRRGRRRRRPADRGAPRPRLRPGGRAPVALNRGVRPPDGRTGGHRRGRRPPAPAAGEPEHHRPEAGWRGRFVSPSSSHGAGGRRARPLQTAPCRFMMRAGCTIIPVNSGECPVVGKGRLPPCRASWVLTEAATVLVAAAVLVVTTASTAQAAAF